jgi:hypothetical protein
MSLMNSTGERLRRATQLWHAYLAVNGRRFELAQFLKDAALEKQVIGDSLASADAKLVLLAQDWLRDSGQPVPAVIAARVLPATQPASETSTTEPPKTNRYLRGVR